MTTRSLIVITLLFVIEIVFVTYITYWREWFWDAIRLRDFTSFIHLLGYFTIVASGICLVSGYSQFLIGKLALEYRTKLTDACLKLPIDIEGRNQRIQEDCFSYPFLGLTIGFGVVKNVVLLAIISFVIISQIGWIYLLLPVGYALVGTWVARKIASPLINLNYDQQKYEARFREDLQKETYGKVLQNNLRMFVATKYLSYFQSFYNQITVVIPYIMLIPRYFFGNLTFGVLMQCAASLGHIIDLLSYFINSFENINKFLSCRRRLKELNILK